MAGTSYSTISFLVLLLFNSLFSQNWQYPVNISSDDNHLDGFPDICSDRNGVLHCVWVKKFESNYSCIFYKKSIDQGDTWINQTKVSNNTDKMAIRPLIEFDSVNHIHVIYKFDISTPYNSRIYYQNFDGQQWSTPENVAEEHPGADPFDFTIDGSGRKYVIWNYNQKFHYRYYESSSWSGIFTPFGQYQGDTSFSVMEAKTVTYLMYRRKSNSGWLPQEIVSEGGLGTIHIGNSVLDLIGQNPFIADYEYPVGIKDIIIKFFCKDTTSSWIDQIVLDWFQTAPKKIIHDSGFLYLLFNGKYEKKILGTCI